VKPIIATIKIPIILIHFFELAEKMLFVFISFFLIETFCRFRFKGNDSEMFPYARFLEKIPEQSEDDFFQNRFSGLTLHMDKNMKLHLPMNRDDIQYLSRFFHFYFNKKSTAFENCAS